MFNMSEFKATICKKLVVLCEAQTTTTWLRLAKYKCFFQN